MTPQKIPSISILGMRGIPANHGGFESFAEHLSFYLVDKGWSITVYCQELGDGEIYEDTLRGVRLVHIPVKQKGSLGSIIFDWISIWHSIKDDSLKLTMGYNTAFFNVITRLSGRYNIINMDGIEWKREKWSKLVQLWFYLNDRVGCLVGNHLIADHPEIANHLNSRVSRKKITMIPYCADPIENADVSILDQFHLSPNEYAIIIARPEPENSILEMVKGFCRLPRTHKLVVLGDYHSPSTNYRKSVLSAANDNVIFPGAIYEEKMVNALRFYARLYLHGHKVGGTNPSLVEALAAGSPVLAHNNKFNRWVAGEGSEYFKDETECADKFSILLNDDEKIAVMKKASREQFEKRFTRDHILSCYEDLLFSKIKNSNPNIVTP